MAVQVQHSAEKSAASVFDQAKEIAGKVSETVQNAVSNVMPGETK
jgi:hypothetical protein